MLTPAETLAHLITEKFITAAPQAAARALESLATHETLILISPLKAQTLITCFNHMDPCKAAAVLRRLPARQGAYVFSRLDVVQAARMMKEFSQPYREKLSSALKPEFVALLSQVLAYPAGSVGALMSTDFVALKTDAKVADAVERLKTLPRKKLPAVCFVTAKDGQLKGVIRTAEMLFYSHTSALGSVMSADFASLAPQDSLQHAALLFKQTQSPLLPVLDADGKILGVLDARLPALPAKPGPLRRLCSRFIKQK